MGELTSHRAQEAAKAAKAAEKAGDKRQKERDDKRAESRATWANRWQKVKEVASNVWGKVSKVGEVPGRLVDGADKIRTQAEVRSHKLKEGYYQNVFSATNSAAERVGDAVGFVGSLPERAKAEIAKAKAKAVVELGKAVLAIIEAAQTAARESQRSGNEEVPVTWADKLAVQAAEADSKCAQCAKEKKESNGMVKWLRTVGD